MSSGTPGNKGPMRRDTPGNKEPMSGLMGGSDDSVHQS